MLRTTNAKNNKNIEIDQKKVTIIQDIFSKGKQKEQL